MYVLGLRHLFSKFSTVLSKYGLLQFWYFHLFVSKKWIVMSLIVFGVDPVGVDVGVTLSCIHDIS